MGPGGLMTTPKKRKTFGCRSRCSLEASFTRSSSLRPNVSIPASCTVAGICSSTQSGEHSENVHFDSLLVSLFPTNKKWQNTAPPDRVTPKYFPKKLSQRVNPALYSTSGLCFSGARQPNVSFFTETNKQQEHEQENAQTYLS